MIHGVNQVNILDHKNCVCKNKLVGRLISECTSIVNETMMNNNDNNFYKIMAYVFIGLFLLTLVICFCLFAYFKWFKGKCTNNNNNNNNSNNNNDNNKIYTYNYKNEY